MVAMPELTVHKDGQFVFPEGDIGAARQLFDIFPVPKAQGPEFFPQFQFGFGIFRPDFAHHLRPLLGGVKAIVLVETGYGDGRFGIGFHGGGNFG